MVFITLLIADKPSEAMDRVIKTLLRKPLIVLIGFQYPIDGALCLNQLVGFEIHYQIIDRAFFHRY
jgi:hypothetical protein